MDKYKRLINNSIVYAIGNFGSKIITFLMLPFYTHMLTREEFGQVDIIITTITLLVPIFTVNIVQALIRFVLDNTKSTSTVVSNSLFFILIGAALVFALSPLFSMVGFISDYSLIFFLLFIAKSFHGLVKELARSLNKSKIYMFSDYMYMISFVVFNIIFLYIFEFDVQGYLLSLLLALIIDSIFIALKIKFYSFISVKSLDFNLTKEMFMYSLPLIPTAVMWWIMTIFDRYMLTYFIDLSANGLYAVANKFSIIISTFYIVFLKAWQISAIEEYKTDSKDEYYTNIFNVLFFSCFLLGSIYVTFNKLLFATFVSDEFFDAWLYAPILVASVIFSSFASFIGTNYVAAKKTKGALVTSIYSAIVNVLLNFVMIPIIGIYGAALSTLISFLILFIIRYFDTKDLVEIQFKYKFEMIIVLFLFSFQIIINYFIQDQSIWYINLVFLSLVILVCFRHIFSMSGRKLVFNR
ncbi:polysaccharide biosynthesis protein [Halobacillus fulvus]|nr:polysaccharide biosynthesis protein [Halobacillus fulvus]